MASQHIHDLLLQHHGGPGFHDVMVESFSRRFDPEFWEFWRTNVDHALPESPVFVDLGCGPGLMLQEWRSRYRDSILHAVELQPYMLESARKVAIGSQATIHEQDLHRLALSLDDASVDVVLASMVIHEMEEPISMLEEVRRVLKPSGVLLILDWVRAPLEQYLRYWNDGAPLWDSQVSPEKRADRINHFMEHNKFTAEDLRWLVEKIGFEVSAEESRGEGQFVRLALRSAR